MQSPPDGQTTDGVTVRPLTRPHLAMRDLLAEAATGLVSRPARTALTALGTVLGIAAMVATLGIAETAGNQIVTRFDELAATGVSIQPAGRGGFFFGPSPQDSSIPWTAEDRLTRLNGVVAAGTKSDVDTGGRLARSVPVQDPLGANEFQIQMIATSPGLFDAVRGTLRAGRWFDEGHDRRADNVAVLGRVAAERLNVSRIDIQPAVFVGDETLVVIGILEEVAREADLLSAIIVPNGYARLRFGLQAPAEVQIETEIGAASLIATQAPIALDPNQPERLRAITGGEPTQVRQDIEGDINALFVILGGLSLLIGALGIANVTLVSVIERVGEIGLRRAVGAARRHIAAQFLLESTTLGFLGGIVGASLGVLVVVAASALRDWTPVLEPWLPTLAPLLGAAVGLFAGVYPAWRAAGVEPIDALRQGL